MDYEIRAISPAEWLPDRCMSASNPLDPAALEPEHGCGSLAECCGKFAPGNRDLLEGLYRDTIKRFGCCGFVAWRKGRILGYNNFFPREIARDIRSMGGAQTKTPRPRHLSTIASRLSETTDLGEKVSAQISCCIRCAGGRLTAGAEWKYTLSCPVSPMASSTSRSPAKPSGRNSDSPCSDQKKPVRRLRKYTE